MSKLEKLKEKAKGLEAKDPKAAIEMWLEVLKTEEGEGEANPDLSVYNRIGDLCLKLKDHGQAADYYERAVDKYAELGFHNNAIAMCNKVLRNAPGRPTAYLKLAKLYASKGFLGEAKLNFVEYAERMHKIGKIQHAFAALKEFADLSPGVGGLREMLEEQLRAYGGPDRAAAERVSGPTVTKEPAAPPGRPGKPGTGKTTSLVFLDLDEPPSKSKGSPPSRVAPREPQRPPVSASLLTEVTAEPDTSLEIETTSLIDDAVAAAEGGEVEGLERTVDFSEMQTTAPAVPSLRDEVSADDVEPLADFQPTVTGSEADEGDSRVEFAGELEPLVESELEIEPPPPPSRMPTPRAVSGQPAPGRVAPVIPRRPGAPASKGPTPVTPKRPMAGPPPRKASVEVPPLELEPDFESGATEVDDQPLAADPGARGFVQTEFVEAERDASVAPNRRSGFIDLGLDEVMNQDDQTSSLVFANVERAPSTQSIEDLEALVADDPDDPDTHRALGEALIEAGDRERGIEELDIATGGFENLGDLAGLDRGDPPARPEQRASSPEDGRVCVQVRRQGEADRRVPRAGGYAAPRRLAGQGAGRVPARRGT